MLRRVAEGLVLAVLAWALMSRVGFGPQVIVVGAIAAFTGWRLYSLWMRYQARVALQREIRSAEPVSDDERAAREADAVRGQQLARGAELTFWTGFIMGGAAVSDTRPFGAHGGEAAGEGGAFDPSTYDAGGAGGGDFGGGGFDGGM